METTHHVLVPPVRDFAWLGLVAAQAQPDRIAGKFERRRNHHVPLNR